MSIFVPSAQNHLKNNCVQEQPEILQKCMHGAAESFQTLDAFLLWIPFAHYCNILSGSDGEERPRATRKASAFNLSLCTGQTNHAIDVANSVVLLHQNPEIVKNRKETAQFTYFIKLG